MTMEASGEFSLVLKALKITLIPFKSGPFLKSYPKWNIVFSIILVTVFCLTIGDYLFKPKNLVNFAHFLVVGSVQFTGIYRHFYMAYYREDVAEILREFESK